VLWLPSRAGSQDAKLRTYCCGLSLRDDEGLSTTFYPSLRPHCVCLAITVSIEFFHHSVHLESQTGAPKSGLRLDGRDALMERESANLDREFRIAGQSYGIDHLDLVPGERISWQIAQQRQGGALPGAAPSGDPGRISEAVSREAAAARPSSIAWMGRRGPGPDERGDRGRRRTAGQINRGGGDDGEPLWIHQVGTIHRPLG
jgi:hypothetical protein